MPHRLAAMMSPIAQLQARKMAPAFEALCEHACLESAMTGSLVARGMTAGNAQMVVDQWRALGLFVPASVYAPAHIAEATVIGEAAPTARRVAAAQPGLMGALAIAPGYEQLLAQPGVMGKAGIQAAMQPGVLGVQPGIFAQPGVFAAQPGVFRQPGIFGQPAIFGQAAVSPPVTAIQFGATPMWGTPEQGV